MGTIYARGRKLWVGYKDLGGKMVYRSSGLAVGQEREARKLLKTIENKVAAQREVGASAERSGPQTVKSYADLWIARRRELGLSDWKNDESRLRDHVIPTLGPMTLDEVRPRHLVRLFEKLRTNTEVKRGSTGNLAPKTIYNIYSVIKALFRDAKIDDLLLGDSPCILTKYQLGENEDKNSEWRQSAIYTRAELQMLISDPRIPIDRQVLYALEGIAALRHGEAAGLCWRHWDTSREPLTFDARQN